MGAWRSNEDSNYNAGQLMVRNRFAQGLQFDFSYTFFESLDLTSETERTEGYGSDFNTTGFILNAFNPNQNRAVSDFDVTPSVNANWCGSSRSGATGSPSTTHRDGPTSLWADGS